MNANLRRAIALTAPLGLLLAASCSGPRVIPAPAPVPQRAPAAPAPAPAPAAPRIDWQDAPITPGDWIWGMRVGQSVASFAGGLLELRCDRARAAVVLVRRGTAARPVPMTIITSDLVRPLTGTPLSDGQGIAVSLPARDPLLDAMAFSRGRFVVETNGLPSLYVPSWPEVSRVIEDCR